MHQSSVRTVRAGDIGPVRREIVFEPLPVPARPAEQPAPPRPADPSPRRPVPRRPARQPAGAPGR